MMRRVDGASFAHSLSCILARSPGFPCIQSGRGVPRFLQSDAESVPIKLHTITDTLRLRRLRAGETRRGGIVINSWRAALCPNLSS